MTVLWQLGATDPLFLNSRSDQPVLLLTTPPSLSSETEEVQRSGGLPQETLVLNSRGRSVRPEGETVHRLRVRRPRRTDQVPAVAPLDHMKAPLGGDQSLTPISRWDVDSK